MPHDANTINASDEMMSRLQDSCFVEACTATCSRPVADQSLNSRILVAEDF